LYLTVAVSLLSALFAFNIDFPMIQVEVNADL